MDKTTTIIRKPVRDYLGLWYTHLYPKIPNNSDKAGSMLYAAYPKLDKLKSGMSIWKIYVYNTYIRDPDLVNIINYIESGKHIKGVSVGHSGFEIYAFDTSGNSTIFIDTKPILLSTKEFKLSMSTVLGGRLKKIVDYQNFTQNFTHHTIQPNKKFLNTHLSIYVSTFSSNVEVSTIPNKITLDDITKWSKTLQDNTYSDFIFSSEDK